MGAKEAKWIPPLAGLAVVVGLMAAWATNSREKNGGPLPVGAVRGASVEADALPELLNGPSRQNLSAADQGLVEGSAFVVEAVGSARAPIATGTVVASSGTRHVRVPVVDGEWSISSSSEDQWSITELWRDGARISCLPRILLPGKTEVLIGYAYEGVFLNALDALGDELQTVSVHHRPNWMATSGDPVARHPGNLELMRLVLSDERTPAYLPMLDQSLAGYWITSENCSWSYLPSNRTMGGGLQTVQLALGSTLAIDILDFLPTYGMRLFLVDEKGAVATYSHLDRPTHVLEGLPPVLCRAYLAFDSRLNKDAALAKSEEIQLYEGGASSASLTMPTLPTQAEHGTIMGTLLVDSPGLWRKTKAFERIALRVDQGAGSPAFQAVPMREKITTLSEMVEVPSMTPGSVWKLPKISLPEGEYQIIVEPFGLQHNVHVRARQSTELNLRIPSVAITVFTVVSDGAVIRPNLLVAGVVAGAGPSRMLSEPVIQDGVPGTDLQIVTLPGDIEVHGRASGFPPIRHKCHVEAGWNSERIFVNRCAIARLKAVDKDGAAMDIRGTWFQMTAQPVGGGPGVIVNRTLETTVKVGGGAASVAVIFFSEPGEYTLEFPRQEEGMDLEPQTISASTTSDEEQILVFD